MSETKMSNEVESKVEALNETQNSTLYQDKELEKVNKALNSLNNIFSIENAIRTSLISDALTFVGLYDMEQEYNRDFLARKLDAGKDDAAAFVYALKFRKDGKAGFGLFYSDRTELFYRIYQGKEWLPLYVETYTLKELKRLYKSYEYYRKQILHIEGKEQ